MMVAMSVFCAESVIADIEARCRKETDSTIFILLKEIDSDMRDKLKQLGEHYAKF